jgi:hypothetical protein
MDRSPGMSILYRLTCSQSPALEPHSQFPPELADALNERSVPTARRLLLPKPFTGRIVIAKLLGI